MCCKLYFQAYDFIACGLNTITRRKDTKAGA